MIVKHYPVISIGGENQILFAWDHAEHHIEVEVFADGHVEAFYYNTAFQRFLNSPPYPTSPIPTVPSPLPLILSRPWGRIRR